MTSGVAALVDLLAGRRATVLAGAGCSTASGIPDYGGLHSRLRGTRIQYREFVGDPRARARYWARSAVGWLRVAHARPNPAHEAMAALERHGVVTGVITQNVDGLHYRAGSRRVVELHGSLSRVRCLDCGAVESRAAFQERILALNPSFTAPSAAMAPDGDAELDPRTLTDFQVPACPRCGGVLKPDVVFFGENVPKPRVEEAWDLYRDGEVLLVVGSSLAVFSGYRFALRAGKDGRPLAIVNRGETRADETAAVKVDGDAGTVLEALSAALLAGRAVEDNRR